MLNSKILFKVSGSIAAYKACEVISQLVQWGCKVKVVATSNALNFVGASTFEGLTGSAPIVDTFQSGHAMDHIHLNKWCDLVILAPATANTINKMANGMGDDLIGNLFLAHDFRKPYYFAPAMNTNMWRHPLTQASIQKLSGLGLKLIAPPSGSLACGDIGEGRLAEPSDILQSLFNELKQNSKGLRILVTLGGTRERIDGVRHITNLSTGKTGSEIAAQLVLNGHILTVVGAENSLRPRFIHKFISYSDFASLNKILSMELQNHYDMVIHAAAVSDFSVKSIDFENDSIIPSERTKISSDKEFKISLTKNSKILDQLKDYSRNKSIKIVAFKLTNSLDSSERESAIKKLFVGPNVDFVVHNDLNEIKMAKPLYSIYANPFSLKKVSESPQALANELVTQGFMQNQSKVSAIESKNIPEVNL